MHLVPINVPWDNHDIILGVLFGIDPEIVVLAGSFQDELAFMRTRHRWPSTVREAAAVAACLGDFSAELGQITDGVLGPSQWEPGVTFPNIAGPTSDWFLDSFQKQFDRPPNYVAAASFATGLVSTECIRQTACLDDGKLRNTGLAWTGIRFTADFASTPEPEYKRGHRVLLVRWQGGYKVVLPSRCK